MSEQPLLGDTVATTDPATGEVRHGVYLGPAEDADGYAQIAYPTANVPVEDIRPAA